LKKYLQHKYGKKARATVFFLLSPCFLSDSDIMQPTPKDNLLDGIED